MQKSAIVDDGLGSKYTSGHGSKYASGESISAITFTLEPRDKTLTVVGYIGLPSQSQIRENSCLKIKVTDTIQCSSREVACSRKIYYEKKIYNFEKTGDRIRYQIDMKVDSETLFEIEARISNGWCGDAIRKGDFLNDEVHSFEKKGENPIIGKDIMLIQNGKPEEGKGT